MISKVGFIYFFFYPKLWYNEMDLKWGSDSNEWKIKYKLGNQHLYQTTSNLLQNKKIRKMSFYIFSVIDKKRCNLIYQQKNISNIKCWCYAKI